MKKLFITISILLFISTKTISQSTFNSEDLTVTKADLEINTYDKDSTANALVIYEYGNSYVDKNSFNLKTEVKQKLKILNREGFNNATIAIYLYNDNNKREKLSNLVATTYNLKDGVSSKIQLNKSQIFEEKYNDNYTIMKFTFPDIREGSVVTYSYTLESPFMFKYKEWYFQSEIPKLYSQYETSIPGNYEYNIKLVGLLNLSVNDSKISKACLDVGRGGTAECVLNNYVMKDVPAFVEEDFMTTKENYLSRVEYELKTFRGFDGTVNHYTKTWETVDKELKLDKNIGRQINKNSGSSDLLDSSIINEKDALSKAKALYHFVQQNYTWNDEYKIFKDVSVKDLISEKSGSVSEINILLHNLLIENDIDVKPILLSTRDKGFPTKIYPVISDFNYLINQVIIDEKTYFLDATDRNLSFGELPFRCLNRYGRLLDFKEGSYWIDIIPEKISTIQYRFDLTLKENEKLSGFIDIISNGYHALPKKKNYFENPESYLKYYKDYYPSIEFIKLTVSTEEKTSFDFNERFEIQTETEIIGDKIYLNPFLFKNFEENPFKLQERSYPIDFGYKDAYVFSFKIQIDDSYQILETPKELNFTIPDKKGLILLNSKVEGNNIMLYFKFNFNEPIYGPEYYPYLKELFSKIVDTQKNSLIVLKKK